MLICHITQFEYEILYPLKELLNDELNGIFSGLNELLNTCKSLSDCKKKHYYWYVKEGQMRREVLSKIRSRVQSPCEQLSVKAHPKYVSCSGSEEGKVSLSDLTDVHQLIIRYFSDLYSADMFAPVCSALVPGSRGGSGGIHRMRISYCDNLSDVSALSGVHSLEIFRCDNISDVSALSGVHNLEISRCRHVPDLSRKGH